MGNLQTKLRKVKPSKQLKLAFLYMSVLIQPNKNAVRVSGYVWNVMYNLQTRLAQFTGQ